MSILGLIGLGPRRARIGNVTLDVSIREVHRATAKATRHPVEAEGSAPTTISDHVHADPLSVTIEGMISNHPVQYFAGVALALSGVTDPAKEGHLRLLENLLNGKIIEVFTTLATYEEMVLEDVNVTRDKDKGNALFFTATATQINLVFLEELIGASKSLAGRATVAKGKANATNPAKAPTETQARSGLAKFVDWIPLKS